MMISEEPHEELPLEWQNLHGQVVRRLGLNIVNGTYPAEAVLPPESVIGSQLGVSRTVVREAMKVLAAKGLVDPRPKTGTRVRPRREWELLDSDVLTWLRESGPEEWFVRHLAELRQILEPAAARLAAVRALPEQVALIESLYAKMEQNLGDPQRYVSTDMEFHFAILAASQNEILDKMSRLLATALRATRDVTIRIPGGRAGAQADHWAVVDAIRRHDAAAAEKAMQYLVDEAARNVERVLGGLAPSKEPAPQASRAAVDLEGARPRRGR